MTSTHDARRAVIEHSADGTLVTGTSRVDTPPQSVLVPVTSRATNTTLWREVTGHLARIDATTEDVADMVEVISAAFPALKERLQQAGDAL